MEKVFHLIVVPCCPMSQSQRISPSWAFRGIDKAGYFGPAGYFGVGWRKLALFVHSIPFSSILTFLHHYPSIISVCLTLTQMHLPQSLQLHRINGFARFFHGFISVLLLHSGHTSKLQFFHCFSIVSRVLYAIMVPHRSLNFTWHHFTLSLFFPPFRLAF